MAVTVVIDCCWLSISKDFQQDEWVMLVEWVGTSKVEKRWEQIALQDLNFRHGWRKREGVAFPPIYIYYLSISYWFWILFQPTTYHAASSGKTKISWTNEHQQAANDSYAWEFSLFTVSIIRNSSSLPSNFKPFGYHRKKELFVKTIFSFVKKFIWGCKKSKALSKNN